MYIHVYIYVRINVCMDNCVSVYSVFKIFQYISLSPIALIGWQWHVPSTGWPHYTPPPLKGWEGPFLRFVCYKILQNWRPMVNASFYAKKKKKRQSLIWSILRVDGSLNIEIKMIWGFTIAISINHL